MYSNVWPRRLFRRVHNMGITSRNSVQVVCNATHGWHWSRNLFYSSIMIQRDVHNYCEPPWESSHTHSCNTCDLTCSTCMCMPMPLNHGESHMFKHTTNTSRRTDGHTRQRHISWAIELQGRFPSIPYQHRLPIKAMLQHQGLYGTPLGHINTYYNSHSVCIIVHPRQLVETSADDNRHVRTSLHHPHHKHKHSTTKYKYAVPVQISVHLLSNSVTAYSYIHMAACISLSLVITETGGGVTSS